MRRTSIPTLALALLCLTSASALAGKPPKDFRPPDEMSAEELAASKARSKSSINDYGKDISAQTSPMPWTEIILVVLVFVGVAPFAYRAYLNTSQEMSGPRPASPVGGRARPEDDAS